jgi:hypothetical protein
MTSVALQKALKESQASSAAQEHKIYRPRNPKDTSLYRIVESFFPRLKEEYEEKYERQYGPWRAVVDKVVGEYLRCEDLWWGWVGAHCDKCGKDMLVSFSCKGRFSVHAATQKGWPGERNG